MIPPAAAPTLIATAVVSAWSGMAAAQSPDPQAQLDAVTISVGRGQLRSVQSLSKSEFDSAIPGTSPLLTVARLPGVHVQSADALGHYEWSVRFAVRSFSQNQLGFTLDDVPLGDMSYGNLNGLHISRAISSENVARAALSQGAGALEAASTSNLGGTLQFYSSDPQRLAGLRLSQTLGSDAHRRTFVRVDSGDTALGGVYLSVTEQNADKWKGVGERRQRQWNLKWVKDWGEGSRLSAFVNTSDRQEIDDQDLSLDMIQRLGVRWDNFYPDFAAAVQASRAYCGNGTAPYTAQCDDAYYAGAGLRQDTLAGASADLALAPGFQLKGTLYTHRNRGRGLWYTPYVPSPDGTPLSLRTTEYEIDRQGALLGAEWERGAHLVKAGVWHERNDFDQARRFYATPPSAVPSPYEFPSQPFATPWQYAFRTRTDQLSLSDTWAVSPALTLGLGFKSLRVSVDGQLQVGSGRPSGTIVARHGFLPQLGLNLKLSRSDELYATVAENLRAHQGSATGTTPFATTQAGFDAIRGTLKPETSTTLEGGWRTQGSGYEGSVSVYHVRFKDRQLGVTASSAIQGSPTVLGNVGDVRSQGLEGAWSVRLNRRWTWTSSVSLARAQYLDDVVSGGDTVPTAGRRVVDTPSRMLKTALAYDDGRLSASLNLDRMGRRFITYLNDRAVGGRTLLGLNLGYRWRHTGGLSEWSLTGGVSNLTNQTYIATIGSNGFVNSDPSGTFATLLPGAPRQVFVTLTARL